MLTPCVHMPEVDSTNAEAMRRAAAGETGPLWIVAERQISGRGRSGRPWASMPGNLFASLLVPLDAAAPLAPRLSLIAGVALHDAIVALAGGACVPGLVLKWPNDVLVGGAKLAGILIDATQISGKSLAVVGIGLNLVAAPATIDRRATAFSEVAGRAPLRDEALAAIDAAFWRWFVNGFSDQGFAVEREDWLAASLPPGSELTINAHEGVMSGRFSGLDGDGALLLTDTKGFTRRYTYGDVTLASEQEMS